uniref:Angel homolog 2 n=3 Tax=Nothobranchius furzeri TaxID=105023 RepID=A0A8C6NNZ8_NOTFU
MKPHLIEIYSLLVLGCFLSLPSSPMFLRWLNSFRPSFRPRGQSALRWPRTRSSAAFSSCNLPQFIPGPQPWWSVQRFPPCPPRLPRPHPFAHQVGCSRTLGPFNLRAASFSSFHTTAAQMMEHPDQEPPNKRRKNGGHEGGAAPREKRSKPKKGVSKREQHQLELGKDSSVRTKVCFKVGSQGAKNKNANTFSKKKDVKRARNKNKNKKRKSSRYRNLIPKSGPERDPVSEPKPTTAEEGGLERKNTGPNEQPKQAGGMLERSQSDAPNQRQTGQATPRIPRAPEPAALQRRWETCSTLPHPPGGSTAFDFSVMSYNVLSQELLHENSYLYQHCHPCFLPWEYRLPNLLAEIRHHDADILCLQEVQEDHFQNQIKPALQASGYQCEFKKRTGLKPDGCAVIFKSSRFSLLSSTPVEFFRPGDSLLDRDNVGLVVLLQPNNGGAQPDPTSSICVANTHLLYNPRRGDIKLAQLAILLAEIEQMSRLPDGSTCPVLLCGDFNSVPWSPLYQFLTTGCLKYRGMQIGSVSGQEATPKGQRLLTSPIWSQSLGITHQCRYESRQSEESCAASPTAVEGGISNLTVEDPANKAAAAFNSLRIEHSLNLQSSHLHRLMPDGRLEITTCHSRTALTVDYIFYSPGSLPHGRGLQLLGRLSLVGHSELKQVNFLPNQHHSSDHLPLLASFCLHS